MTEPTAVIELKEICRSFEGNVTVLDKLSLSLFSGQSVAITGPSGSGKSTLLNILGGLDKPSSGSMTVESKNLAEFNEEQLAQFRNQRVGFVFQLHHLLPQCTALENVLIPTLVPGSERDPKENQGHARSLLGRLGLGDRLDHRPGQLSGGERQRVAVARALINKPLLILADEPTGALDQSNSDELMKLLIELNEENQGTLVVVTHAADMAKQLSDHYELEQGQLKKIEESS